MRSIVVGTAGHIDHGKSALVRALTGTDPDRLKEERERGITIDLGFAHLEINGVSFAFIDVPGHERFVKNMLAGAGGIDLVMLVVASDESVMPQTREHFHICRLLQVPAGVIVLTKTDLTDDESLELARLEVRELVDGSFLANAPLLAVSSRTGDGLEQLRAMLVSLAASVPARLADGPARLPIDRVFSMKGFGTVVTGTLVSGRLHEEQELIVLPRHHKGMSTKVRGLQVHGRRVASVDAGRRVAVNVGGVDVSDLERGDTLCARGALEPTRRIDAVLELLPDAPALRHGARIRFHQGTTELLGRVALADRQPGSPVYARIRLESPAVVTRGDRFIIRAYSPLVTVGGGVVLDPQPPRGALRSAAGLSRLRRLDLQTGEPLEALTAFVEERAAAGLARQALVSRAGLSESEANQTIERLVSAGQITLAGDLLVSRRLVSELGERLVAELRAHHQAHPLSEGMPREEARGRIFRRAAPGVFDFVVDELAAARRVVARDWLALEGHHVSLSPEEARAQATLERIYRDAKLSPPDLTTAGASAGITSAVVERVIALLLRSRTLVKVDSLVFHSVPLEELKTDVRALKQPGVAPRVDVATFKERYGITRKYAIPLLEYLDRERVTRRVGDARIVL